MCPGEATLQGGRRPGLRNAAEDVVRGYRDVGGELDGNILEEAVDSVILRCVSGGAEQHGPGGCAACDSFQHSRSLDRKSVVSGKGGLVCLNLGGRGSIITTNTTVICTGQNLNTLIY